ncbi:MULTISPECIES: hypothetical protein [unclassified Lysobacter]|uniref:hypothetical protein n=1 Tax=unclassified Lysobacter TaxID=2635362 RepID=UPI001BE67C59|nr:MULTISPECIES: hypothetical protein [unclassified Lysobacter]MBT2748240.1 hypothetical protein [Lysobacter sp. ISL-42]MBT2749993.1 hypothetical protein [Lysobacter sp. ISL-50]MBT2781321.1 hypothetical protein [Lysobacter sp. ISL-52]
MKIETAQSHLFRNTNQLQNACILRLEEMSGQFAPALDAEELIAAKAIAAGAWRLVEIMFETQGMELTLRFDTDDLIDTLNKLAG